MAIVRRWQWKTWLARSWAPRVLWLVGLMLVAPSLANRPILDDLIQGVRTMSNPPIEEIPHTGIDLYTFGKPGENERFVERGILLPWWTGRDYLVSFFRPISALTHDIDRWIWSDRALIAHAHSLAWYGLLLAVVSSLYRNLVQPAWLANFAFLLYVLDDTHGDATGWTASRHAIIATALGALAVLSHDRWRRAAHRGARASIGPICFCLALLASETAVEAFAYLLSYAVFVDDGPRRHRLLALTPYAIVLIAWRVAYHRLGYGAAGTTGYLDPGRTPLAFIVRLPERVSVLLQGQLGYFPSDFWTWSDPTVAAKVLACAVVLCLLLSAVAFPLLREDRMARFWGASLLGALVPSAAALPCDRTLLFPGIAAMAFMARLFAGFLDRPSLWPQRGLLRAATVIALTALFARRVVFAPLLLPLRAHFFDAIAQQADHADRDVSRAPDLDGKTLIIVNPANIDIAAFLVLVRATRGETLPRKFRWFATGESEMMLTRTSERSLSVRPRGGFLRGRAEHVFRNPGDPIALGEQFVLSDLTVTITERLNDGNPTAAEFTFRDPLESSSYVWMRWDQDGCKALPVPRLGETVMLSAINPLALLQGR